MDPEATTFHVQMESRALPALNSDDKLTVGAKNKVRSAAFGGEATVEVEVLGPSQVRYLVTSDKYGAMEYTDNHTEAGFSSTLKVAKTGKAITDVWKRDPMIEGWFECVEPAEGLGEYLRATGEDLPEGCPVDGIGAKFGFVATEDPDVYDGYDFEGPGALTKNTIKIGELMTLHYATRGGQETLATRLYNGLRIVYTTVAKRERGSDDTTMVFSPTGCIMVIQGQITYVNDVVSIYLLNG